MSDRSHRTDDDGGAPAQVFPRWSNTVVRLGLLGGFVVVVAVVAAWGAWYRSPGSTGVGWTVAQPVPFSHAHHAGDLDIDCRYCHGAVQVSSTAGLPTTDTCMNCHWQLWTTAELLEPVRDSWRTGRPIRWQRVHNLPDFVYFNHSIHIAAGVGCETCHGRVDQMPLTAMARALTMQFCLDCHRDPRGRLRPRAAVFDMGWPHRGDAVPDPGELVERYAIDTTGLTDCVTCHR